MRQLVAGTRVEALSSTLWALASDTATEQQYQAAVDAFLSIYQEGLECGIWSNDVAGRLDNAVREITSALQEARAEFRTSGEAAGRQRKDLQDALDGVVTKINGIAGDVSGVVTKVNGVAGSVSNVERDLKSLSASDKEILDEVKKVGNLTLKDANLAQYVSSCQHQLVQQMEILKTAIAEESNNLVRRGSDLAASQATYTNLIESVASQIGDLKLASHQLSQVTMSAERYTSLITNVINISEFIDVVKSQLTNMAAHYNEIMRDWHETRTTLTSTLVAMKDVQKMSSLVNGINDSVANILHIVDEIQFAKANFSKEVF